MEFRNATGFAIDAPFAFVVMLICEILLAITAEKAVCVVNPIISSYHFWLIDMKFTDFTYLLLIFHFSLKNQFYYNLGIKSDQTPYWMIKIKIWLILTKNRSLFFQCIRMITIMKFLTQYPSLPNTYS